MPTLLESLMFWRRQPTPQAPHQAEDKLIALKKLKESFNIDPFDMLYDRYWSNGEWWLPAGGGSIPGIGGTSNKVQGHDAYVFRTEQELRLQRDRARYIFATEPLAQAIVGHLRAFTVGCGFVYQVKEKKKFVDKLNVDFLDAMQQYIDGWIDKEDWCAREQELFNCQVIDGEWFLRIVKQRGEITVRRVEPEHITNPPGGTVYNGWYLGVNCDPHDAETVLGYYFHAYPHNDGQPLDVDEVIHFKDNVTRNVSRGVSSFFCLADDLDSTGKLIDNCRDGAAARARIAYIRSHKNTTPSAVNSFAAAMADASGNRPNGKSWRGKSSRGSVEIDAGENMDISTMPSGDSEGYISAVGMMMRVLGNRWGMPEFMVSGDASNNNYASILVSGGPFVRQIEYTQAKLKRVYKKLMEQVLKHGAKAGTFPVEMLEQVEIDVQAPSPVIQDKLVEAQTYDIEARNKVISPQEWAAKLGRDPEKIQQDWDAWNDANMEAMMQQPGMGGGSIDDGSMSIPNPGADALGMDGVLTQESVGWAENKHPRASDGRFGHVAGSHGGRANVVSKGELDTHIKASKGKELYRGVPKKEYAKQFETGELRHGKGAYGHGIYVGYGYNGRDTASKAAGDEGHLARMSLSSDAKTITWNDAEKLWNKEGKDKYSIEEHGSSENAIAQMMRERGYDAIDVEHNEFMNVLNAEALVVEGKGDEKPKKKLKVTSQAEVSMKGQFGEKHQEKITERLRELFPEWDDAEVEPGELIASITGMPDDATRYDTDVAFSDEDGNMSNDGEYLRVSVTKKGVTMTRLVGKDAKGVFVENKEFFLKDKGTGLGAELFSKQIEAASSSGIYEIRCHAACENADGKRAYNGYYTWPRMGYDQPLEGEGVHASDAKTYNAAKEKFPGAKTVLDVMETEEGRSWWKKNGTDMLAAKFDLSDGSRSMRIHQAYMQAKSKKST